VGTGELLILDASFMPVGLADLWPHCFQVVCGLALKKVPLLAILNAERITQRLLKSGAIR
jgi:hypothetical protein